MDRLQQWMLSSKTVDLFNHILKNWNTNAQKAKYIQERSMVVRKLNEQDSVLSQARKLFVAAVLKSDDYAELRKEYQVNSKSLKRELHHINIKLEDIDKQIQLKNEPFVDIFQGFPILDTADKRHVVDLIPPIAILAKNVIQVDDEETAVILDFLYLMAKNYKKIEEGRNPESLERSRTPEKMQ